MQNILQSFLQLIQLKAGPERLPYSYTLLYLIIGTLFLVQIVFMGAVNGVSIGNVLLAYAACLSLSVMIIAIILAAKNLMIRLHKMLIATFGVELFFVCFWALSLSMLSSLVPIVGNVIVGALSLVFVLGFIIWSLMVRTYVFSVGFNEKKLSAFFILVVYELVRNIPLMIFIKPLVEKSVQ